MNRKRYTIFVLLFLIYFLGILLRLEYAKTQGNKYFSSESALRFSYAQQLAQGKDIAVFDYSLQFPEGYSVYRYPLLLEKLSAYLYQPLRNNMTFSYFIRLFLPALASLAIVAVYLIVKELTRDDTSALFSALFYALSRAAVGRASGWEFLHETLALPLIFFHIYFFIRSLRDDNRWFATFSGIVLFFALGAWNVTQYYFLLYAVFIAIIFVFKQNSQFLHESFIISWLFAVMAAFTLPFLRNIGFINSYSMAVSYVLALLYLFRRYMPPARIKRFIIFSILTGIFLFFLPRNQDYAHVQALLFYKLRFLGFKPYDPSLLPFDARLYWVPPYTSPALYEVAYQFLPIFLLVAICVCYLALKSSLKKITLQEQFFIYNVLLFLIAYLLVRRFSPFLMFFLVIIAAVFLYRFIRRETVVFSKIVLFLVVITFAFEYCKAFAFVDNAVFKRLRPDSYAESYRVIGFSDFKDDLFGWITDNTAREDVILAHYPVSTAIRAYTGRTAIINSLVETEWSRRKIEEFIYTVFGSEDQLYNFCKKYQVDYFIYTADTIMDESRYGWRYLANAMNIDKDMAAYKMHFFPEQLAKFSLVYETDYFRVYKVLDKDNKRDFQPELGVHPLVYQHRYFEHFSESVYKFQIFIEGIYKACARAEEYLLASEYKKAYRQYVLLLKVVPDLPRATYGLAVSLQYLGSKLDAIAAYEKYMRDSPGGKLYKFAQRHIKELSDSQ